MEMGQYSPAVTATSPVRPRRRVLSGLSLIFGIFSVLCSCTGFFGLVLAVAGVVLAIAALCGGERNGMSVVGLILGLLGLLVGAAMLCATLSLGTELMNMTEKLNRGEITQEEFSEWLQNIYRF